MRDGKSRKARCVCTREKGKRCVTHSRAEGTGLTLAGLGVGQRARISTLGFEGQSLRRLIDLGFSRGSEVRCVGESPLGDPRAYEVRGAVVAIRGCDAVRIALSELDGACALERNKCR